MSYKLDQTKVLIVDDMKPMLALTTSILKVFGFNNIYVAEDGEEAFEIVCKEDPDLIITDWLMDPMDGLELTQKIRKSKRVPNPYIPVIMMTGFSSKLRVEHARDTGITEFLVKPFTANDLYLRISHAIEKPRQFVSTGEFFGPDRRRKFKKDYPGPRRRDDDAMQDTKKQDKTAHGILKQLRDEAKDI